MIMLCYTWWCQFSWQEMQFICHCNRPLNLPWKFVFRRVSGTATRKVGGREHGARSGRMWRWMEALVFTACCLACRKEKTISHGRIVEKTPRTHAVLLLSENSSLHNITKHQQFGNNILRDCQTTACWTKSLGYLFAIHTPEVSSGHCFLPKSRKASASPPHSSPSPSYCNGCS